MKYQVGDIILVRDVIIPPAFAHLPLRPFLHSLPHLNIHLDPLCRCPLLNTFGIITKCEKHIDIFKENSSENDNRYVWYSQVGQREYYFYENEVEGEVVK